MTDLTPAEESIVSAYLRAFIAAPPETPLETIIATARLELAMAQITGGSACTH